MCKLPNFARQLNGQLVVFLLVYFFSAVASSNNSVCVKCYKLITSTGESLEPSGLVWADDLGVAIAVNDERSEKTKGYDIFYFDPYKIKSGQVVAQPLMTPDLLDQFVFSDLEGLTRLSNSNEFYAIGSLSLDKSGRKSDDNWSRHQAFRFEITKSCDEMFKIENMSRVSNDVRPDLREWIISSSEKKWENRSYSKRAEAGGINVEGLASTREGGLVIGFRGPLEEKHKAPVLFLEPIKSVSGAPKVSKWSAIDLSGLDGKGEEKLRGIRAIELIPDIDGAVERYVVIVGHTGGRYDQLRLVSWTPTTGALKDHGILPKNFVGEGVTAMGSHLTAS